jgi:hypothetical protein
MRALILIILVTAQISALGQLQNQVAEKQIKSAHLSQLMAHEMIQAQPSFDKASQGNWFLTFDDLSLQNRNAIYLKVLHCQSDWKVSPLSDIEFLQDFNDIPIRDSQASMGTKVPYRHYQIALPRVKIAGNYVVMVYNRAKRDTILTQRFCVYNQELTVATSIQFGRSNALRASHQNLELRLKYPSNLLINAAEDLKIYVKQNELLGNQLPKMPLGIINPMEQMISFPSYQNEQAIAGGNEYRLIDLRSTQQKLSYIDHWEVNENETRLLSMLENPQGNYAYVQRNDSNGAYLIENYENPGNPLYADYVTCTFRLKAPKQSEALYVCGAFNQYQHLPENELRYIESLGIYEASIQLKQGIYNYRFETKNPSNYLEGNYAQTENSYEIFVYLRKPGKRYDELIGYQKVNSIH